MELIKKSYCEHVRNLDPAHLHRIYHDTMYGFAVQTDNELFERLILEINQAGLSWDTILRKQTNFKLAYHNFDIEKVAAYQQIDIDKLLTNTGIIRNKLKIIAAIYNANAIIELQKKHGSFKIWLDMHHKLTLLEWVKLFKITFKFTGGEIVNEFLLSTGYLPNAHEVDCPIYKKIKLGRSEDGQKRLSF